MHPTALLFAVRQVGVHITLSVVLRELRRPKSAEPFCVPFFATSLTISSVGAAYMPPAHLFLDRQCNLPSPCRDRARPTGAISVSKNHILAPLNV